MSYPWSRYSKKLAKRIEKPFWVGKLEPRSGMRQVIGFDGNVRSGNAVQIYWLVDESDGVIADAAFQLFGQSALIGAADIACELSRGKNHDQAGRIGADLIDKHVRDRADTPAFPAEVSAHLNLVVGALEEAAQQCKDMPLPEAYVTPIAVEPTGEGFPDFPTWSKKKQLGLIEQVIADDIRPYVELDEGGVQVIDLIEGRELLISYSGSCTSCYSATGSTLSAIQQIVRSKVHPELVVVPEM
jgi:NifU-like protein